VLNRLVRQRGAPQYLFADNVLCGEAAAALGQQISARRYAGSALQKD
jgi:putative transposase